MQLTKKNKAMIFDLNFKDRFDNAEINGINEYLGVSKEWDIDTPNIAVVEYELQPDAREWGVKGISVVPKNVSLSIVWIVDCFDMSKNEKEEFIRIGGKYEGRNHYPTINGEIEIETDGLNGWDINSEVEFHPDGAVYVDSVEIDLHKRVITLS